MKLRYLILCLSLLVSTIGNAKADLKGLIQNAMTFHPQIKMATEKENQALEQYEASKSTRYPTLDLLAVTSIGFPGSNSPLPQSFGGLMTSPYRAGYSYGLLAKYNLFDLEKLRSEDVALAGVETQKNKTNLYRQQLILKVLAIYLESARLKSEQKIWSDIVTTLNTLSNSTADRIKSGQVNEVSLYLISEQLEEAKMNLQAATERFSGTLDHLTAITGIEKENIQIPGIEDLAVDLELGIDLPKENVEVEIAKHEVIEARNKLNSVKGISFPKIFMSASAGYLADTRVVESQNYSGFIGISLPLFEGFKTQSESRKALAGVAEKEYQLHLTELQVSELNLKTNEEISISRKDLESLTRQKGKIDRTLALAKNRYVKYLGPMADLREALRVKSKIDVRLIAKKSDLIYAVQSSRFLSVR